jgi:hypothetical protein
MGRDGGGTGRDGEGQINGCQQEMELRDDVFKIHKQDTLVPLDLSFSASVSVSLNIYGSVCSP